MAQTEARMRALGLLTPSCVLTLDEWEIPRDRVVINRKLGEGAFGTVYGGEAFFDEKGWVSHVFLTLWRTMVHDIEYSRERWLQILIYHRYHFLWFIHSWRQVWKIVFLLHYLDSLLFTVWKYDNLYFNSNYTSRLKLPKLMPHKFLVHGRKILEFSHCALWSVVVT